MLRLIALTIVTSFVLSVSARAQNGSLAHIDEAITYAESQTAWSHELDRQLGGAVVALSQASEAELDSVDSETIDRLARLLSQDFTQYYAVRSLAPLRQRAAGTLPALNAALQRNCVAIGVALANGTYPVFRSGPPSFVYLADVVIARLQTQEPRASYASDIDICEARFPGSVWQTAGMEPPPRRH